jgi:hypothetical protein
MTIKFVESTPQCESMCDGERCRHRIGHPGAHYAEAWTRRKDGQPDRRWSRPIGVLVWT